MYRLVNIERRFISTNGTTMVKPKAISVSCPNALRMGTSISAGMKKAANASRMARKVALRLACRQRSA
jgi:hypothetical protein